MRKTVASRVNACGSSDRMKRVRFGKPQYQSDLLFHAQPP